MNLANQAHLHLVLNHVSTVGVAVGLAMILVALAAKNEELKRASLIMFFGIALLTIPVYMSGKAAQQAIQDLPGVSAELIDTHQDTALLAYLVLEITGFVAWLGLWQRRRTARYARWHLPAVLVLAILTFGLMARAASYGGEIRHPEIAAEGPAGPNMEWLKTSWIAEFVDNNEWTWTAAETLHFIGLSLLFGVVLIINLRMLGVMKGVSFAALHGFLPWALLGFGINLVTGTMWFIATPEQYTENIALHWKMVLMLLAAVNVLYFTMFDEAWAIRSGDDSPPTAKVIAISTIGLWLGVIYFGRMMPFIGTSF